MGDCTIGNLTIALRYKFERTCLLSPMPAQFYIGTLSINTYTACVAFGAMTAMAFILWPARHSWQDLTGRWNAVIIIAVSALALGRFGYVLYNATYFAEHITDIVSTYTPGISEHTALVGGLLGFIAASRFNKTLQSNALIAMATCIGIGAAIGCIPHGCGYGREVYWTDGQWWLLRVDWPDVYALNNPRLPTQLFMAIWLVFLAIMILGITRRHSLKTMRLHLAAIWLLLFACGDFAMQFLRADPAPRLAWLRLPQWMDLLFMGFSGIGLMISHIRLTRWRLM